MRLTNLPVMLAVLFISIFITGAPFSVGQVREKRSYDDTRKLLARMERNPANQNLKRLFEEADTRMPDLLEALNDSELKISINAQVIIKYLAESDSLRALDSWCKAKLAKGEDLSTPRIELLSKPKYLQGNDSNLTKLAMRNRKLFEASRFNAGDVWIRVIAYNKRSKTALLEVVQGEIFTAGWHAVIRQDHNRWVLISDNNVWVS